ncbi:ABC transporter permease [Flagellimonas nanhaiensis]|uniref:DUF3526 domain-containing protein n=1 Tax=Flagellimonas nanhaiensis TaxID=2292706 RepID=A0A371JV21_9FLAO|nr:DUF3526 domain-containing protein [Allomuricauda nanhaiensis]RDY61671.1 DUF3526 domain-containing protein [Allomuricauda nanhaiensis]
MIRQTFLKEIKELLRDGRPRIALIIVGLLLLVAVWISARQYENTNAQYEIAKQTERGIWDGQSDKNPHSAAHFGTYAFKPKYPLSLLDQGVDKYAGVSIFLEAHNRNEAQFSAATDQTGLARFGDLTPDFILLFLVPLLIVLLGFNTFTKEGELGTLALLRSSTVPTWKLVLGKWMALFIPVLIISLILFGLAGAILSSLKDYGVFEWSSLFMMLLVYLLYYVIFINLVMVISFLSKRSGISLVTSLSIWILTCLAVPKIASTVAEQKYPYPTRQVFEAEVLQDKKSGLDGHNPWSKEAKLLEQKVLAEYKVDSLHQLPFNFDAYRMQKGEEHEAEVYFKHYKFLKEQYNNQSLVYQNLAVISPFLPTRFLSMAIAHTDYGTHWDFSDAAEKYRVATQKFLNDDFAKNSSYGDWSYRADASKWATLPPFEYQPSKLKAVLSQNATHFLILGIWTVLSFGVLFVTAKRI